MYAPLGPPWTNSVPHFFPFILSVASSDHSLLRIPYPHSAFVLSFFAAAMLQARPPRCRSSLLTKKQFTPSKMVFHTLFWASHWAIFAYRWWKQASDRSLAGLNTLKTHGFSLDVKWR